MRFFQVKRPDNPRGCWAASWWKTWRSPAGLWEPSSDDIKRRTHSQCKNYARHGHLTCWQHNWRENAAWAEAERLAREEKR